MFNFTVDMFGESINLFEVSDNFKKYNSSVVLGYVIIAPPINKEYN